MTQEQQKQILLQLFNRNSEELQFKKLITSLKEIQEENEIIENQNENLQKEYEQHKVENQQYNEKINSLNIIIQSGGSDHLEKQKLEQDIAEKKSQLILISDKEIENMRSLLNIMELIKKNENNIDVLQQQNVKLKDMIVGYASKCNDLETLITKKKQDVDVEKRARKIDRT
ncbi:hypothetical protein M0811_04845 [Anaeramoeba ignava]|uniref:Uncharacterized protein n=1 Tax=Anaeramoeba ignava TaxID=1746090 RepID=A0A9Q0LTQ0_ANAIG|nr:hypothetical protein M0811_04845 [Anaeramoeba ignava]